MLDESTHSHVFNSEGIGAVFCMPSDVNIFVQLHKSGHDLVCLCVELKDALHAPLLELNLHCTHITLQQRARQLAAEGQSQSPLGCLAHSNACSYTGLPTLCPSLNSVSLDVLGCQGAACKSMVLMIRKVPCHRHGTLWGDEFCRANAVTILQQPRDDTRHVIHSFCDACNSPDYPALQQQQPEFLLAP